MNTISQCWTQFRKYAGPLQLALIWLACVLLGWASVGRFRALLEWGALLSLTGFLLAGIGFGTTGFAINRLKRKHDRMAHNGVSDAKALSRIERRRFVAVHLLLAFGVFGIASVAGGFLTGFVFSGVLFCCGLMVTSVLVWACFGLPKNPTSAVSFFVQPV